MLHFHLLPTFQLQPVMRYLTLERFFTAYRVYSFTFTRRRSFTTALTQRTSKSITGHTSHVPGYRLALSTFESLKTQLPGSKVQLPVYEVGNREVSKFKEQWVRILSECGVSEPHWSVKWIVQHVLRGNPHNKVPTRTLHVLHRTITTAVRPHPLYSRVLPALMLLEQAGWEWLVCTSAVHN